MAMTQSELDYIFSKFNESYMDTVYACVNIFPKRKDGKKIGVRWGMIALHGEDKYIFFYGDTPRGKREKGICFEFTRYGNTIIERTPEQVKEWCEKICGGEDKYRQILNTVNQQKWEDIFTL